MKTIPKHTLDFIDSWLQLRSVRTEMPGFSVAIAKGGKVLLNKSYGYADLEAKEELTPQHVFRIASHSKTFTATAIFQLVEQGKLRIDDHVIDYIDWLKAHADKRWRTVTIRQLLSHSAGVIRDGLEGNYWQLLEPFPDATQLREAVMASDLVLDPNVQMKYSNIGYSILGQLVEAVAGVSYNEYVMEHIVAPLGLSHTFPDFDTKRAAEFSHGYSRLDTNRERQLLPHAHTNAMSSATGFCSTAEDLCRYFSAQMVGSGELLNDESKREMQRSQWHILNETDDSQYGLGFDISICGKRTVIGHGGGFPGFITSTLMDATDKLVVTVLTNCHDGEAGIIVKGIFSVIDAMGESDPKQDFLRYEGRFANLGSMTQIVACEKSLTLLWPNKWWPFNFTEDLERIDDTTLRITKASGYSSEGELVRYVFTNTGAIDHIEDSGSRMQPSEDGNYTLKIWE